MERLDTARIEQPVPVVTPGARTPEELEGLYEDAMILTDLESLEALVEEDGIRYSGEIGQCRLWSTHDVALMVTGGVTVARRQSDGTWQIAIALSDACLTTKERDE